jgi:DNA-binding beta-propeller fold protein YncE
MQSFAKGPHRLEYEVVEGWDQLPEGWAYTDAAGVAVDSQDRVYVFCRGTYPVVVFDKEGKFLDAWGKGEFLRPHGCYMTEKDELYLVDDQAHSVHLYSLDGKRLKTIGGGAPSDTGYEVGKSPVQRASGPFNWVTNVARAPDGTLYAADGYGNARVHRFSAEGELLTSWGEQGGDYGEFNLPHGIGVDSQGLVYVCDRENSRIQISSPEGEFLRLWDWVGRPTDIFIDKDDTIYVAELGFKVGATPCLHFRTRFYGPPGHDPIARVTVTNPDGEIIHRIGGHEAVLPGNFIAPHGLWVDRAGSLYVGEVTHTSGGGKLYKPEDPLSAHCFQKFIRRG